MKKILVTVMAFQAASSLLAHEIEGGSNSGLFGLKPEYIHVLLNPLPVYGLGIGLIILLFGLLLRKPSARTAGLFVCALCAASAWPVLYFGQHGYNHLYPQLDTESQQWLDAHMSRAERFIYLFYATAALAVSSLVCLKKFPKAVSALSTATLLLSAASLGIGGWISRAGGEVSHSEFRTEGAAPEAPAHEHQHGDHGEKPTNYTNTKAEPHEQHETRPPVETNVASPAASEHAGAAHQHQQPRSQTATNPPAHQLEATAATSTNVPPHEHAVGTSTNATHSHAPPPTAGYTVSSRLTDTPEGLWTQLHRHQAELKSAIAAKQVDQIHPHAEALKLLTAALVQVVHPDHKASVEAGADTINQAISAAHKSAHAEDLPGVESHFKEFNEALQQLQEQMRKQ
jgi:hypothetical protein